KGGDLLAQIDPSTFQAALDQAEGQLSKDEAQRAGARVDLERYRGLLAKDSIARQTVDAQRFTVQQLEGAVRADKAAVENVRLQLTFTRITAPFAGRVGLRQVDPGNMVHASDANGIVVLTQTHPIYVVFAVPSEYVPQINRHFSGGDALPVESRDRDGKDGVRRGEKVVIDGLDKLRDGAQVALIADSARGAASPATLAPPPGQRPHRRHTASSAAPSAQPPAAPVRMTS